VGVSPTSSPYLNPEKEIQKHTTFELPHWQQEGNLVFATWRLADSLPKEKLDQWRTERDAWITDHPEPWDSVTESEYHERFSKSIDSWLDAGSGGCILKEPAISSVVANALRHFDHERYELEAFVVMPNHVHVLFRLSPAHRLEDVIHSWKSFTAKEINKLRGTKGEVWQKDYWDRIVRDAEHRANVLDYIRKNPDRARLSGGTFVLFRKEVGETPTLLDVGVPPTSGAYCEPGIAVNSGFLDGLPTAEAKAKMIDWLESTGKGKRRVQFKLRDWLFSRQRYWGEPFPILWKDGCHHAIPESELPLLAPPLDDYKPSGSPEPILSKATEWVKLPDGSVRETNTMPQWAGSCWYYLRYCDPSNTGRFMSAEAEAYWKNVDLYVGGTEHAVLHLLYARFWHKVLHDLGHVGTHEPFQRLVNQGLILGEDGQKMSKSRGNVVNPDDVVREYGADALRLYEMFMGPLEQVKPWQMKGVEGVSRFLARVWRVAFEEQQDGLFRLSPKIQDVPCTDKELLRVVHETIKKVGEDIEKLSFNTAISQMMICTNAFTQAAVVPLNEFNHFLTVLNPFAPHLSEEIHERVAAGFKRQTHLLSESAWPSHDPAALVRSEIEFIIQVNGKLRDRLMISKDAGEDEVKSAALASPKVHEHVEGKTIRKIVFVPGKLLNIVAS
jgi:leucyl-tRNA synthetase